MSVLPLKLIFFPALLLFTITALHSKAALDAHYYDQRCPQAEKIIDQTVLNASIYDPKVPARILRMFFHDCFIRGCDASILLDSTTRNQAEKDGPPNISNRAFQLLTLQKLSSKLHAHTVSCAGIIAIAARDVVTMVIKFDTVLKLFRCIVLLIRFATARQPW